MKLLLLAYECSPYRGSECAVGWGRMLGAAKIAETHVVTSEANFLALDRAREEGLVPANVTFHTPTPDAALRRFEDQPVLFAYNYRAYHHWQQLAETLITELHGREHFDVVHQVNVCTFREPGYGHTLGTPFVWGPVGGTQNFPLRFLSMLPPAEAAKEGLRTVANKLALRKSRVRLAARKATVLFAANSTNARDFAGVFGQSSRRLLETGLHEVIEPDRTRYEHRVEDAEYGREPSSLKLLWSGELQTRKALPILLKALTLVPKDVAWQLDVLGDGPMGDRWAEQARRLGLWDKVRFVGRLPFAEATRYMHSADLFCFSSLRDTSGNVVLEALAAGVPVVCFDHQGASDMVSASSGVKLPVHSPSRAYRDWAQTIEQLARNPEHLLQLSYGATTQARQFLWSTNHDIVNGIYRQLTDTGNGTFARPAIVEPRQVAVHTVSPQAGVL